METMIVITLGVVVLGLYFWNSSRSKKAAAGNIKLGVDFLANNAGMEGMKSTASGLQYQLLTQGEGSQHPAATDQVKVHYHGTLMDGTVFDSSVDRGESISFGLNQVIKGWTEGLQMMVVGDKMRLFIPSHLAYGNRPTASIPAGSLLIFDVELLDIH